MKIIIYSLLILFVVFILSCSSSDYKMDYKLSLQLEVSGEFPDKSVVMKLVNNSENDYCILGFEGFDINRLYFDPFTNDTSWIEHGEIFFLLSRAIPEYNPEMETSQNLDLYSLPKSYDSFPEFIVHYEKMRELIKKNYDEEWTEYYQSLLWGIFCTAIFIKSNDVWGDTLFLGNYFQNAPNSILKISFSYPRNIYSWNDTISIRNTIYNWQDELGLKFPRAFDGFRVITDEIRFSDSVIVQKPR